MHYMPAPQHSNKSVVPRVYSIDLQVGVSCSCIDTERLCTFARDDLATCYIVGVLLGCTNDVLYSIMDFFYWT